MHRISKPTSCYSITTWKLYSQYKTWSIIEIWNQVSSSYIPGLIFHDVAMATAPLKTGSVCRKVKNQHPLSNIRSTARGYYCRRYSESPSACAPRNNVSCCCYSNGSLHPAVQYLCVGTAGPPEINTLMTVAREANRPSRVRSWFSWMEVIDPLHMTSHAQSAPF